MKFCYVLFLVIPIVSGNEIQLDRQERRLDNSDRLILNEESITIVAKEDENSIIVDVERDATTTRGLVPQLWANYTGPVLPPAEEVSCDVAQMKCAYRAGCGLALKHYGLACLDLAEGKTKQCSSICKNSLIALLSTQEGKRMMKVRI